jgi:hypothetical protein
MQQNVGTVDRIVRTIAGLALIAWGIYTQNWWGAIGVVFIGTALLSWCPAYLPFGINSRK